ncbi:hypothetical protein MNBD_GAMMA24-920 [hydrothermal vent metagenome]|uniref:Lcl C-terminal domain-containing protein n=1 Tax=hydrothermal vent metagenome TaxID=652676 RepID=A0A3B1BZL8_9ZZZZ
MWRISLIISLMLYASTVFAVQICKTDSITATTPTSRYTLNGDGTVTDKETGLMWKQCLEGLSGSDCETGNASAHTWQSALQIPEILNAGAGFAGYIDWRLANIMELQSIVEVQCYDPAINLSVFPNAQTSYVWSSSPAVFSQLTDAWDVNFYGGSFNGKYRSADGNSSTNYLPSSERQRVRLVRGGQ